MPDLFALTLVLIVLSSAALAVAVVLFLVRVANAALDYLEQTF